ncbi:MAG: pantoate--beta-alanine ligase [Bacteroidetes bacterium HGW-Bacteroidetes-6]|jgi:pantoate--beta-alanine ligase|nr:MAG: pantoate--beta-alanine ligase [Bacteroidetes bacterium HGW-Bacteroidetes-6]
MKVTRTVSDYEKWFQNKSAEASVGFVPTMGFLHRGHISLIEASKAENDFTVCSIFVNPIQFNNPEDLKNYPRNEVADLEMLEKAGCDVVFIPPYKEVYPKPVTISFAFPGLDDVMEGEHRPGHFNGVAVVVSRLFEIIRPNLAYFGKKDYQQWMIIDNMTHLKFPGITIKGMPIVREEDGLAMSSRNARLSKEEREIAPLLYEVLKRSRDLLVDFSPAEVCNHCKKMINNSGMLRTEYFTIADAHTLVPIEKITANQKPVAFVAAWLGNVRLIDNLELF